MQSFEELGLTPELVKTVEQLGFLEPTPIQEAAIPVLFAGRDVIGQAQTGTGKTAAFALPMIQKLVSHQKAVRALILAPTRELAIQVTEASNRMAVGSSLRFLTIYGGQSYQIQTRALARGVDVVVGTPGRLLDLIRQKYLDLSQVSYLVVDEADEMLEMGFIEDVETILAEIPTERQIALFSATMPDAIRKLAKRYLREPETIAVNPERRTVAEIDQRFFRVREDQKLGSLTRLVEMEDIKCALIFTRTKARAQELADEMNRRGYPAESLHGDLNQSRREAVLNRFRQNQITLLVATDVAARGLDIDDVSHVFNYDVPNDPEDYIHRIGRTGRAGRKGVSITFFSPREARFLSQVESYTRQKAIESKLPTRDDVLARRDERFITKMYDQMVKGKDQRERAMITQLLESDIDLVDLAAAAMKLARAGEHNYSVEEISQPVAEVRSRRTSDERYSENRRGSSKRNVSGAGTFAQQTTWSAASQEGGMVRLKMNLGGTHGIRPGDVVGAIAGEVGIPGKAIGAIDIQERQTFVDVAEKHVKRVLQASTGQYSLRGKPVMLTLAG